MPLYQSVRTQGGVVSSWCIAPIPWALMCGCFSDFNIHTVEYSCWSDWNLTWSFAHLQSLSSNDGIQNFSCCYPVEGYKQLLGVGSYRSDSLHHARAWWHTTHIKLVAPQRHIFHSLISTWPTYSIGMHRGILQASRCVHSVIDCNCTFQVWAIFSPTCSFLYSRY